VPTTPRRVAVVLLVGVAGFQAALALGAPWGTAALGGVHPGVLPHVLRVSSAVAAVLYLGLALVVGTSWTSVRLRRRSTYGASAFMVLGSLMNIASPSFVERMIWTPFTIVLMLALWHAARLDTSPVAAGDGSVPLHV
jgi:hypothetical protein